MKVEVEEALDSISTPPSPRVLPSHTNYSHCVHLLYFSFSTLLLHFRPFILVIIFILPFSHYGRGNINSNFVLHFFTLPTLSFLS